MISRRNQLIEEYLRRFDNASVFLAADRREELRQELVEHIDAGLEEADALHAKAVRAVLERLGPPADIVAAELSGPRSTGSTPTVKRTVPATDAARKHEIHRESQMRHPQDDAAVPQVSSLPSRRRTKFLIGAAATTLVVGALAFGISTHNSNPGGQSTSPVFKGPTTTPSQSHENSGKLPSGMPTESHYAPTMPPSPSEVLDDPTPSAS
ncbi:hypothetical protein J7E88_31610 [Streptomyces sp. ISL-10]|uniref:HAAS signaling domain-containing protein n=1 Tax=Streptomyces sp. ISL-10 TaxID=2819172 RepID=UPI001BE6D644|nr:hypothetical protein [Streptomyces sp. ISL-10]MBT2369696.1 hypothetical protein [Streptomyces sp. ISL-10]